MPSSSVHQRPGPRTAGVDTTFRMEPVFPGIFREGFKCAPTHRSVLAEVGAGLGALLALLPTPRLGVAGEGEAAADAVPGAGAAPGAGGGAGGGPPEGPAGGLEGHTGAAPAPVGPLDQQGDQVIRQLGDPTWPPQAVPSRGGPVSSPSPEPWQPQGELLTSVSVSTQSQIVWFYFKFFHLKNLPFGTPSSGIDLCRLLCSLRLLPWLL